MDCNRNLLLRKGKNYTLPIVRYWIPHIRVISPEGLQKELEKDLRKYLERVGC